MPFIENCLNRLPKGIRVARFRADSASYQASVINLCQGKGMRYVIGADLDCAVKKAIESLPASSFRPYRGGYIAETVHTMNKTDSAFRLIVVKVPIQSSLPGVEPEEASEKTRYKVLATNHKETPEWIVDWYNQRGETSENRIKEWKTGFGMERMASRRHKGECDLLSGATSKGVALIVRISFIFKGDQRTCRALGSRLP